jgi:murein L,D-transpeptidase YcbB/YkuD
MRSRATPAFFGTLDRFILNPLWYVPRSIATRDLLPKQRKDPGYLPRKSIRVFADAGRTRELDPAAIDWTRVSAADFPYFLRQDPGPGNSLGRIKFPVSNPFGIFLHDTPNPALFEKPNRALSSGCIRLEDPAAVAAFVRNDAENWPASRIRELMDRGEAQVVRLPESVPVYVAYFTAWVDQQDTVQFRTDLYGRNARIATCDCGKDPGCR